MSQTPTPGAPDLAERLLEATTGTLELFAVHIGRELKLYEALDRHGPLDAPGLAELTSIHPRYAREWLEQQAVAGFIAVDGSPAGRGADADESRTYVLPTEHRGALVDPIDADHLAPFAAMVVGIAAVLDDVVQAFRSGTGVPYASYGTAFRHGQGAINRPAFTSDLVKSWLPAVDGVADALADGGRLLDVGTGHGWSAIAVKSAWPAAEVVGIDTDVASIEDARRNAEDAGVDVTFEVADPDGDDIEARAPVDVVIVMEALHDMSRPVQVLAAARRALAEDGCVVVADEAVAESFTAPGDVVERMMFGWSVNHCLPASMAEHPSAAIGTAIRPGTVADLARAAGFGRCEVVDVDAGFFRIYRLSV